MKLLHTSDWHLGRLFHNVSLLEDQSFVLDQIVAYIAEHDVDVVLIAGDLFDRAVPPAPAIALLDDTLHRLTQEFGIPVIVISGNHDSAERLAFGSRLMAGQRLHIAHSIEQCNHPIVIKTAQGESAAIFGIPYHTPEQVRTQFKTAVKTFDDAHRFLMKRIEDQPQNTDFRILMSHCFVDGAEACDSERPLAVGGVERISIGPLRKFDYVALGHLHGQQQRGAEHIRYSGSPMKYSFSEQYHQKGVTLVELSLGKPASITQLPLKPLRNMRTLTGKFDDILQQAKTDNCKEDFLAITLSDNHAILDAMAKLREVYPNVLQLEKTYLKTISQLSYAAKKNHNDILKMTDDFFLEVSGENLDDNQKDYISQLMNGLERDIDLIQPEKQLDIQSEIVRDSDAENREVT